MMDGVQRRRTFVDFNLILSFFSALIPRTGLAIYCIPKPINLSKPEFAGESIFEVCFRAIATHDLFNVFDGFKTMVLQIK